jgi:hypothetical protein
LSSRKECLRLWLMKAFGLEVNCSPEANNHTTRKVTRLLKAS